MSGMLASVCSKTEARVMLGAHADLIDCKNPHEGALGALPLETIVQIVETVDGKRPTSATVGDDVRSPRRLRDAILATADCGVDYVKFGLFDAENAAHLIDAVAPVATDHDLVAVMFADRFDPEPLLLQLANSGVRGVMIDTADKHSGTLTSLWSTLRLVRFVAAVQSTGMICGLAGRLGLHDVETLLPMGADYLGFRSALCRGDRRQSVDSGAAMQVRRAIPFRSSASTIRFAGVGLH